MTVFSEKVQPTFTNSDLNVIIVKDFNEIFFDVFELEINGNKFVAEKVSEKNGKPIISLPIDIDGTKFNTNFLLEKGNKFEIYYNGETGSKVLPAKSKTSRIFDEPPVNIFERKEPLIEIPDLQYAVDNIKLVKESAAKHIAAMQKKYEEQYQLKEKRAASKNIKELESIRGEFKGELISDFYKITESLKNQIADYNLAERAEWDKHFSDIFEEYSNSVDRKIEDNFQQVISKCENKIHKLTDDIFTEKLISIIESKSNEIEEAILDSQRVAFNSLDKKSKSIDLQVVQNKKELIGIVNEFNIKYTESLTSIRESSEREGIEISRSVNKALSRIGNIRTVLLEKLSTDISRIEQELKESIVEREGFIKDYFNNKIKILNEKFTELSDDYKEEIITLIQESEQRILDHTSSVSTTLPTLILKEAKNGKNKDNVKVSLEDIRKELEGNISNRFSSEIVSLKRLIEMTSGGGGGGGPSTGGITVETDPVFTTWAHTNSANYDYAYNTILTGGSIGGDLNVTGSLTANSIQFNLTAGIATPGKGELAWDVDDDTLHFSMNGVVTRLSQDSLMRVKATEVIKKGQAVMATGAQGQGSGVITAALFRAGQNDADQIYFIGVAAEDMAINDIGFVSTFGKIKEILVSNTRASDDPEYNLTDQNGWEIGTVLYVSPTDRGKFTQIKPIAPSKDIATAIIIAKTGNTRTFFVRYEHGYDLDDLHDVRYTGVKNDGDLLTWNGSASAWEPKPGTANEFNTWAYANSANYDLAYNTILTGGNIGGNLNVTGNISGENIYSNNITSLENKLEAVYSYLIQNFENTYIATSVTINDFVSYEWSEGLNLRPGDILLLSGANIAYILGESDGSGLNDYYQVNLKPNFIFFKANLSNYSAIDTFPLSSMKSSKYIIQVEDKVNNDIFYCELNVISNGVIATVTEYGSNYSTNEPFVEFGAETDGIILSLSATGLGRDMSNFIIKGNRTNIF